MTLHKWTVIVTLLALPLAGCVRTSDGSLEPRYVPEMKRYGRVPVVSLKPNRKEPETVFPLRPSSAPPPRIDARKAVSTSRQSGSTLSCRQVPGREGRVKMDCR